MTEMPLERGAQMRAVDRILHKTTCNNCAAQQDLMLLKKRLRHDLQAPLRALKTLPQWIREDLDDTNACTKVTEKYLSLQETAANRLDTMLVGLLMFLEVGTTDTHPQIFDCEREIANAFLSHGLENLQDIVVSDPLRQIKCNKSEFVLLLNCLLSNAVKHCCDLPMILMVDGKVLNNRFVIAFIDNGPGIDAKDFDRIFQPFETLKPRDQVEGSGLGLAIAAKILRKWGGDITVQSDLGAGSRFVVSFPVI